MGALYISPAFPMCLIAAMLAWQRTIILYSPEIATKYFNWFIIKVGIM